MANRFAYIDRDFSPSDYSRLGVLPNPMVVFPGSSMDVVPQTGPLSSPIPGIVKSAGKSILSDGPFNNLLQTLGLNNDAEYSSSYLTPEANSGLVSPINAIRAENSYAAQTPGYTPGQLSGQYSQSYKLAPNLITGKSSLVPTGSAFPGLNETPSVVPDVAEAAEEAIASTGAASALSSAESASSTLIETGEALQIGESVGELVNPMSILGAASSATTQILNSLGSSARSGAATQQYVDSVTNGRGYSYGEVARQNLTATSTGNNTQNAVASGLSALLGPVGALIGNFLPNSMFQPDPNVTASQANYNSPDVISSGESTLTQYTT